MKNIKFFATAILLLTYFLNYSQETNPTKKIKITGKIIEKSSNQPLEYATIAFINVENAKLTTGGITDAKGDFSVDIIPGTYNIKAEFISFKPLEINQKKFSQNTNLGNISLLDDATQLNEVVVRSEKTTLDIKLDKKIYTVGQDIMVKGGTVSDILDNIPSVAVDAEGTISLRGNENVRILIDGKPSNAINITDALRMIPADAIDKVEVVTNPSARYDAEGGGGLLNIILKKGKNKGFNGTLLGTVGYPENDGLSGTLNYKTKKVNFFTTQGYNYRSNPGNAFVDSRYLNADGSTKNYVYEKRANERLGKGYNGSFGMEWNLTETASWTNSINYRNSINNNVDDVNQYNYDLNQVYTYTRNRTNIEDGKSKNIEYTTNFTKLFKKQGHKLTIDGNISNNTDDNVALITDTTNNTSTIKIDNTYNFQKQERVLIQSDYVLPLGKDSQFEAGYRGDNLKLVTDYKVVNDGVNNPNFTNVLEYIEHVNALYTQYGTKINKLSMLFGLRFEDSNIQINQLATNDYNTRKYNNFFPSAFFTYQITEQSSASISYSKRIQRPRGRQINPFNNLSSNTNIFVGNPKLNPAFTDAIDFGYLNKFGKATFNTSLYLNKTTDSFQFVRSETGTFVNGIPVLKMSPINLATEYRVGFEFTLNYSPVKWWRLNSNFNFFKVETKGNYSYVNFAGTTINQNFDNKANSWSTRLTSKITLPNKIDWQTNMTYNGAQSNAQGKVGGVFGMNLAFSKDVLKDKATVSFNVSDVFNSRKRIMDTNLVGIVDSHAEMQWRVRQFTLSFTYRFNKMKNEKEKPMKKLSPDNEGGGGEF
jgi:outer membrane receptor for ferrienterochelin and colicins